MSRLHAYGALPLAVLLAVTTPHAGAASEQPAAVTATFQGEVTYSEEAGLLDFSGSLIVTGDNMRIELLRHQLDEQVILLVDYPRGTLTVLYPDTLNGTSHELAEFDQAAGFERVRDALLGKQPEPPPDWIQSAAEPAVLDGAECVKRSATSPDGVAAEWWIGPDGRPLKVEGGKEDLRISVTLGDYQQLAEIDPQAFTVPEGFAVESIAEGAPEGLPRL